MGNYEAATYGDAAKPPKLVDFPPPIVPPPPTPPASAPPPAQSAALR